VYFLPVVPQAVPQATVMFDAQPKALLLYEVICFHLLTAFHFVRGSGSKGQYSKRCGACDETLLKIKKVYLLDGKIMPPPKKGEDMPPAVVVKYISWALPMHRELCPYVHHNVIGARVELSSGVCLDSLTRIEPVGNHDSFLLLEHLGTAVVGHYLNEYHPRLSQLPVVEGGVAKLCNSLCLLCGISVSAKHFAKCARKFYKMFKDTPVVLKLPLFSMFLILMNALSTSHSSHSLELESGVTSTSQVYPSSFFYASGKKRSSEHALGGATIQQSGGGRASKQARGSTTPMGPLFAVSYPARLFNTAKVLSLARSAGLDVLQPAYQNFVSSLSSFDKTVPKELVNPQADAPRNVNQPLALLAAAAKRTATGSEAVVLLPTQSSRMALFQSTTAAVQECCEVEGADDSPVDAGDFPKPSDEAEPCNSQSSFNCVSDNATSAVVPAAPRRSSRPKFPIPRYQPPASGSCLQLFNKNEGIWVGGTEEEWCKLCLQEERRLNLPSVDFVSNSSFSCIEKGKAVASDLYQLIYYSVPPPLPEIGVVGGLKLSSIKCFELFYKAPIAFSKMNHKREDTRASLVSFTSTDLCVLATSLWQ